MSTPCSQSLRPNRSVVSEYEVPKVLVSRKWCFFIKTPCTVQQYAILDNDRNFRKLIASSNQSIMYMS